MQRVLHLQNHSDGDLPEGPDNMKEAPLENNAGVRNIKLLGTLRKTIIDYERLVWSQLGM